MRAARQLFLLTVMPLATAVVAEPIHFLGAIPGETTEAQLVANPQWGRPKKTENLKTAVELQYHLRAYSQVRVWLRGGVVQTIDVGLAGHSPSAVASALGLGTPLTNQPLPDEALIGPPLPPELSGVVYSAGRVVLFVNPSTSTVEVARFFAPTKLAGQVVVGMSPTPSLSATVPGLARTALVGPTKESRVITQALAKLLPAKHLSQHPLDDQIAERTWYLLLKKLDPSRIYFMREDIANLKREVHQLDDDLRRGDLSFPYHVFRTYLRRLNERTALVVELIDQDHDFSIDESYPPTTKDTPFLANELEVRDVWRRVAKYRVLQHLIAGKDEGTAKRLAIKESIAFRDSKFQLSDQEVVESILTCVGQAYDPRSYYVSQLNWDDLRINSEQQLMGIGASLQIVDGQVQVTRIVPGGPAEKDGRLQPGDRILAVAAVPSSAFEPTNGRPLREVVNQMRGEKGTQVRLRVLPAGAFESQIYELTRDRVELAQLQVTQLGAEQLDVEGDIRVSFMQLSSFYGPMSTDTDARTASKDVKAALEEMKADKTDLLVIDLRGNTSGNLYEALEVAALFVGTGTVVQGRGIDGQVHTYNAAQDFGRVWDRPLVVLTDGISESAAELFAGAIQDYGAGIVVGDRTSGNGLSYEFFDLGKALYDTEEPPKLGQLRAATLRIYGVNGVSPQLTGITPDVLVPSRLPAFAYGAPAQDFPLQADRVQPASFERLSMSLSEKALLGLAERSEKRRAESAQYQQVMRNREALATPSETDLQYPPQQSAPGFATSGELPGIRGVAFDFELKELLRVATEYLSRHHYRRAEQNISARQIGKAIGDLRKAVAADPQNATAHFKLSWVLSTASNKQFRDGAVATEHAGRAIELSGRKWSYLLALALAEAEAGDFENARQHLDEALENAPESQRQKYAGLRSQFRQGRAYGK